mgnify:CR=1 FL=1
MESRIERLCRERGLKMTDQRRVVARVLSESSDHPDAEEVYRRAAVIDPKISLSTVYRTVNLFEDSGIIERHDFRQGRARYEQMRENHHDHLINLRTGEVIEFQSEEIEKLQAQVARKLGYNPTFMGSSAAYTDLIHKLGGAAMNGLYATHTAAHPYLDDASKNVNFWANKYKTKFNEDPTVFSVYGYQAMDIFASAVQKAGANLTTDAFIKAMDSSKIPADMFGSPEMSFTATKRLGNNVSRMSQIVDGRWKVMTDYK